MFVFLYMIVFFFFKQKTAYDMRISDWSSDVCSSKQPDLFEKSRDPGTDNRHQESVILKARISALKERIERYNAQPRREFVGPSAQEVDYAEYVEAWRKKIELLGTEHYPDQARGKVYGSLQLTVYIRRDGSLERIAKIGRAHV